MPEVNPDIEALVKQVQAAGKYNAISPGLVRSILAAELKKGRSPREAVKAARTKLHQVGAVYQGTPIPYDSLQVEMDQLPDQLDDPAVQAFLLRTMEFHSSTRERQSILPRFFAETLAAIQPIHSILDIACGLNPLAIPWMPLAPGFCYSACDIYSDMIGFLNQYFTKFKLTGDAFMWDVTEKVPTHSADLALVLKTIPCLEQLEKDFGARLLAQLDCPNILVSFPSQSLGGRSKGMAKFYENHFNDLVADRNWHISRFEFPGEIAFLVRK